LPAGLWGKIFFPLFENQLAKPLDSSITIVCFRDILNHSDLVFNSTSAPFLIHITAEKSPGFVGLHLSTWDVFLGMETAS